jgi:hypothetical protein
MRPHIVLASLSSMHMCLNSTCVKPCTCASSVLITMLVCVAGLARCLMHGFKEQQVRQACCVHIQQLKILPWTAARRLRVCSSCSMRWRFEFPNFARD